MLRNLLPQKMNRTVVGLISACIFLIGSMRAGPVRLFAYYDDVHYTKITDSSASSDRVLRIVGLVKNFGTSRIVLGRSSVNVHGPFYKSDGSVKLDVVVSLRQQVDPVFGPVVKSSQSLNTWTLEGGEVAELFAETVHIDRAAKIDGNIMVYYVSGEQVAMRIGAWYGELEALAVTREQLRQEVVVKGGDSNNKGSGFLNVD